MKAQFKKRNVYRHKAIGLVLAGAMLCLLVILMSPNGEVSASPDPGFPHNIVWRNMKSQLGVNDTVFGKQEMTLYFVDNENGAPAYCINYSRSPYTAPDYSPLSSVYDPVTYEGLCALLLNGCPYYHGGLNKYVAQGYTQYAVWLWLFENGYDGRFVSEATLATASPDALEYFNGMMKAAREQRFPEFQISPGNVIMQLNDDETAFTGQASVKYFDMQGDYTFAASALEAKGITVEGYTGKDDDLLTFTVEDLSLYSDMSIVLDDIFTGHDSRAAGNLFFCYPFGKPSENGDYDVDYPDEYQNMAVGDMIANPIAIQAGITLTFPADAEITGTKKIEGVSGSGMSFTFEAVEVSAANGDTPKPGGKTGTGVRSGEGVFSIGIYGLTAGNTYYFKVTEQPVGTSGWDDNEEEFWVTITVSLTGDVSYSYNGSGTSDITFTNTYTPPPEPEKPPFEGAEATISGTKAVTGVTGTVNEQFTFVAQEVEASGSSEPKDGGKAGEAGVNVTANGSFEFNIDITGLSVGEHYFKVTEKPGVSNGWTYSGHAFWATVDVTSAGVATVTYDGEARVFTNTYKPPAPGSVVIGGNKAVTGSGAPNATFEFTLTQLNSTSVNDVKTGGVSHTVSRTGAGAFVFPEITGLEAGTYYFRVHETAGGAGAQWANDTAPRVVTVTVPASGAASYVYTSGGASTFTNRYTRPGTETITPPSPSPTTSSPSPGPSSSPSPGPSSSPDVTPPVTSPNTNTPPDEPGSPWEDEQGSPPEQGSNLPPPPPPPPPPGNVVPDGDSWIELDENGTPLGRWEWDPETETWIFDPFPPLGDLPQTGFAFTYFLLMPAGVGFVGAGRFIVKRVKRGRVWPEF